MTNGKEIKNKILNTFADLASTLGYSSIHGKIIGVLLIKDKPIPLQELARETGYSSSMISLSLDLLEVLGTVKKIKKSSDRKLYVELSGDLLSCLKDALLIKVKKGIDSSLSDFRESKRQARNLKPKERKEITKTLDTLQSEIQRLDRYIKILSDVTLP